MRVRVISDVHAAADHLRAAARDCDVLVVLGDLLNVIDYRTMDGILSEIFGREAVAEASALRARGRYHEARATLRKVVGDETEVRARFAEAAREQYEEVFDAMPDGAVVTYGNVDIPEMARAMAPAGVRFVDGEVVELAGLRWGIVGGGMPTPLGIPGEVPVEAYDAKLAALGPVDVVGTHVPPRIPWLCYDTVAERFEPGSDGLIAYVQQHRPRYALYGHVHQPLAGMGQIGPTRLVNVGHFAADGQGWEYEAPD